MKNFQLFSCLTLFVLCMSFSMLVQAQSASYTKQDYIADCQESRALNYPSEGQCACVLNVHSNSQKKGDLNYIVQSIERFEKRLVELETFFDLNDVADAQELRSICVFSEEAEVQKAALQNRFDDDPTYRTTEQGKEDLKEIFEIEQSIRAHYIDDFGREIATRPEKRVYGAGQKVIQYCKYNLELYKFKRQYDEIVNGIPEFNKAGHVLRQKFRQCVQ